MVWSCSPRDSQESSPTPQFKNIISLALRFLYGPPLTSTHDYWKNHTFNYTDLYQQNNISAFNMLSRFVITFLSRCKHILISWLQSPSVNSLSLFGAQENRLSLFLLFPIYLLWSGGTRCHDLHFLNVEFQASFFTLSFTFIKRLFSSSSLSAIRVVSSAYLRLLIFLLTVLIPAWASSCLAFHMMYSPCKLNKQGDNLLQ